MRIIDSYVTAHVVDCGGLNQWHMRCPFIWYSMTSEGWKVVRDEIDKSRLEVEFQKVVNQ